jgi:hypothetical protein
MKKTKLPKLPAASNPGETLAKGFARSEIARLKRPGNPWDEDKNGAALLTAEANSALMRRLFGHAMHSAIGRMGVIDLARTGNTDARDVLREAISEIDSRDLAMPVELKAYRNEVFVGIHYRNTGGPKKQDNIVRDICITILVDDLRKHFGIKPFVRSRHRRSGCAIAAEALEEANMLRGEEAVRSIFKHWWPIIAPLNSSSFAIVDQR